MIHYERKRVRNHLIVCKSANALRHYFEFSLVNASTATQHPSSAATYSELTEDTSQIYRHLFL